MAASAPRKTAARKNAPRKRTAAKAPADLGLVLDDDAARAETDKLIADREPLFTIGGTTYTIPKQVPPSWSVKAFTIAATQGESAAISYAAEKLLTPAAWEALRECETVTPAAWQQVFKALMDRILPESGFGPKA
ncbi:hypothetical protein ACFORO_25905 [Amycolatopsis halotolerans]|uniref:Tail assembly chaperone n=1 Tax=Amycolatopsis halotolerans TaxID=330083 RepID=A0ABV7QJY1_9PSEU